MKKTFKLVMKKNVEGNEWVVRVYINGKYDEGKTYYGDDNKEDAEASMLDMRRKLKKDGYEEEIKEGDNMKSTFKNVKEEVIEERKIIDGIKKGIRGVVDVLDAALVPRGLAGDKPRGLAGDKKCACRGEEWVNCECSKSNRKKKKEEMLDMRSKLKKDGYEEEIKEELEEIKTLVDQILEEKKGKKKKKGKKGKNSRGVFGYGFGYNNDDTVGDGDSDGVGISEGQDISDAVGEFFELMVNLPIHSSPPLYFWKELVDSSKIAKSAYDKNRGIGRN